MADFNKPKIPQQNTPKPSASTTPSPKQVAPNPAPKFNSGPSQKPTAPKATPKLNGGANPKPTAPKVDPVRQKIMSQGFAPKQNANELSNVSKNVDRDSAIKKAHDDLYNSGKLDLSGNTITKNNVQRIQKELGEDYPEDEIIGWIENNSSFRKPTDYDEATERSKASELFDTNLGKEGQPLSSTKQDGDNDDFDEWNNEDNPGSAVVSGRLMDYVRRKLSEDPELSQEFIDKTVKGLYQNSNQADYYKGKMKEDWERRKASKLYDTDLKEKNPFWPRDKNYQEPEGFKSEEWVNADLEQKSDEDLIKMHDNLSKKLWHLQYRSPEEEELQSKIEREYLKRHPVNLDDEQ